MSRSSTPAFNIRRPPIVANSAASSSNAPTRSGTPLSTKKVISLEEWERLAPLTDEQLQSIAMVKEKFSERPLPQNLIEAESSAQGAARPSTPPRPKALSSLLTSPSKPSSRPPSAPGSPAPDRLAPADTIHPVSIVTPQQFHDHFTALTLSTEHEQDSLYRDHLAEITTLKDTCDSLLSLIHEGELEVGEMLKYLGYVEEKSESLRGACEDLLEEQTHLLTHTSQLAHRLSFFTYLEQAQRMLNSPGNTLVLSESFLPMVKRLDECIGYLEEHRDFKDAELYLIRYQQCMTRSMTLIKLYFVNTVKTTGQEVLKRINESTLSETALQALIYSKFITLSASLRPLVAELETRVSLAPNELTSSLAECHSAWVAMRQSLIGSRVAQEVGRMDPNGSDLVELTRAGCTYLKNTCLDEFNLFKHFFLSGEAQLYGFLEGLCDYLYDHLRPRILHEPSLETLCGVCTVLQALMVHDVSSDAFEDDETIINNSPDSSPGVSPFGRDANDYFSSKPVMQKRNSSFRQSSFSSSPLMSRRHTGTASILTKTSATRRKSRKPLGKLHTEVLLRMVLQDAQTRLVFRAQAMIQADVQYYVAKETDLDYPENLNKGPQGGSLVQRPNAISLDLDDDDDDDEPAFLNLPSDDSQASWYPTLRMTLWVLSCLYTYVDAAVFDDLAQESLLACRQSLSSAAEALGARRDKKMDGRLFLVRHLLILKEMTAGLEMGKRDRARDWSGITNFLKGLLDNATTMLGYSRGSIVKANELGTSAKIDIDRELKKTCEDLIALCTTSATRPLRIFLDQCSNYLSTPSTRGDTSTSTLPLQAFATPEKVKEVHEAFKKDVNDVVAAWKVDLTRYLQDEETVKVLVPPAQNSIVDVYRQFHDLVRAEYDFTTAASIMTPSAVHTLLSSSGD